MIVTLWLLFILSGFVPAVVEFDVVAFFVAGAKFHGAAGVLIEVGGDEIGDQSTPFQFLTQGQELLLNTLQDGA